jgi:hypothetical protein
MKISIDSLVFGCMIGVLLSTTVNLLIDNPNKPETTQAHDTFDDPQVSAEQMVILHYIKHHIGTQENEMMFEHSDGILTTKDYDAVLERVRKDFNIRGLNETYSRNDG